jgi:molybdate transport repressor ModE-like protein
MLDPRRLRVLQAVAREGSLSGAARALDYTQPAISHQVARLEDELGTPLLLRTGRGVRLTEAGEALVVHADAVLALLATAQDEIAEIAGLRAGRVRLAAFPSASATLVPAAASALKAAHPGITVSLVEAEPPEALGLLRAGEVDLAVAFEYGGREGAPPAPESDLTRVPLGEDELFAVLRQTPPGDGPVAVATLHDETWIAGCERCRRELLDLAAAAGFEPRIAFATDDYVTVQALVAAGLGVALLPSLALRAARRSDVAVAPLAEPARRRISAFIAGGPRRPPALAAMIDALRSVGNAVL